MSTEDGNDIQEFLIDYVANFVTIAAGEKFNPHVTIGVGTEAYLNEMLAEPFEAFTFSPAGASVYQLGSFGTARKELQSFNVGPLRTPATISHDVIAHGSHWRYGEFDIGGSFGHAAT